MEVFDNIKKFGKTKGWNVQTIAEKAGLSKNVIYQYKKDVNPSLETLAKIANVLGVTTNDLLGKKDDKDTNLDMEVEDALNAMRSYQGKPITESQREILRGIVKGYLDNEK